MGIMGQGLVVQDQQRIGKYWPSFPVSCGSRFAFSDILVLSIFLAFRTRRSDTFISFHLHITGRTGGSVLNKLPGVQFSALDS